MHAERTLFSLAMLFFGAFLLSTCLDRDVGAVKKRSETPEKTIERLSTELRLRAGELAVARSQLAACRRRCGGSEE